MRSLSFVSWAVMLFPCTSLVSCTLPDSARCGDGEEFRDGGCYDVDTDTQSDTGPAPADGATEELWLGDPCACEGTGCETLGTPVPTGGTIVGCDNVPAVAGGLLACMRTGAAGVGPASWFANGYCSVMSAACTGDGTLCAMAAVGEYGAMTACPSGSALLGSTAGLVMGSSEATVTTRLCVPLCSGATGECREGEVDPELGGEASQYQCCDVGGVRFCCDPRNLNGSETATAF